MSSDIWYVVAPYYDMATRNAWVDAEVTWLRDGTLAMAKGRLQAHLPLIVESGAAGYKAMPARVDAVLDQPVAIRPDLFRPMSLNVTAHIHPSRSSIDIRDTRGDLDRDLDDPVPSGAGGFLQLWDNGELVAVTFRDRFSGALAVAPEQAIR
jgi:hypothetical protein